MFWTVFGLLVASSVSASPVAGNNEARQASPTSTWAPSFSECPDCFLSDWTHGPECTTATDLMSVIRRVATPPAEATATFTPTKWCSDYLRVTRKEVIRPTTKAVFTHTLSTTTVIRTTTTDYDHPTLTMYCPIPSAGMECGWDSNTVMPGEQEQDWSVERNLNSTQCQQECLIRPACKAYRLDDGKKGCEIFNVALGKGASNVYNPTPSGSQWWDRNCQKHMPTGCSVANAARRNAGPAPVITPAPTPVVQNEARELAKRKVPLPRHLSDFNGLFGSAYIPPACSCIISSVLPPVTETTTSTWTEWTSSTTVKETITDIWTLTETPRQTTVYNSIN